MLLPSFLKRFPVTGRGEERSEDPERPRDKSSLAGRQLAREELNYEKGRERERER